MLYKKKENDSIIFLYFSEIPKIGLYFGSLTLNETNILN